MKTLILAAKQKILANAIYKTVGVLAILNTVNLSAAADISKIILNLLGMGFIIYQWNKASKK